MTCSGCVTKVKSELLKLGDVTSADVQLAAPQATITMQAHIPLSVLQAAIDKAGNYKISETAGAMQHDEHKDEEKTLLQTYKPVLLIGLYIAGITLLFAFVNGFNTSDWLNNFMAAFFITFSFFKMLDVKSFAESYSTYDVIAKRWLGWGYLYPFIELALGVAFLLRFQPLIINGATFVIMSVSIIGVLQSVFNKRKIKCACLGAVFNLPMSSVTIIEDATMIVMSAVMTAMMIY